MDFLRLAFKYASKESSNVIKTINSTDKEISKHLNKLGDSIKY